MGELLRGPNLPRAWPPNQFDSWRRRWRSTVFNYWDNRFALVPGSSFVGELTGIQTRIEPLRCRLELHVRGIDSSYRDPPHLRARVEYLPGRLWNQSCNQVGGHANPATVDSYLDDDDLDGRPQTVAVHEFGHQLGLWHRCWIHPGLNQYCEGERRRKQRDAMAMGDGRHPWHAWPWWRRLVAHDYHPNEIWCPRELASGEQSEGWIPSTGDLSRLDGVASPGDARARRMSFVRPPTRSGTTTFETSWSA